jgi:hypothetical protein
MNSAIPIIAMARMRKGFIYPYTLRERMNAVTEEIIRTCKTCIETNNLDSLQSYYSELAEYEYPAHQPDWPCIFHRVYLHACLKGKKDVAEWLEHTLYPTMDGIQQIALRQIFPYGRHLLFKSKTIFPNH